MHIGSIYMEISGNGTLADFESPNLLSEYIQNLKKNRYYPNNREIWKNDI